MPAGKLAGFAITGLLLVYLLVALHNYLRTPTGERPQLAATGRD